ncbi:LLM class F420-dependent oxidoreductase [Streptomyces sp. SBT349]|uniref:LLM class F420-dependent oxidoreductase n=1 Tax=Streptomyces sp. SBT349 TaxID=1580539 RepID=UPI00066EDE92|nr:LLM class F420-dependent oxidoreductase [Streptomyces sp. SBT349]
MDLSVVAASREDDRPPLEAMRVGVLADRLGYREVWLGEGPTWDAFVLATAIGTRTERVALTAGPMPVSVRDPASITRGAAGAAALVGRPVGVALGASSVRVVEEVHGRSRAGVARALADSAAAVRALMGEGVAEWGGGFRRRLGPPGGPLTVAAFGERAIAVAAEHADRMVLDMVSPEQVRRLRASLDAATRRLGRQDPPRLAAWLPVAVDPSADSYAHILSGIAGYLTVRGYADVLAGAGFAEAVELARAGVPFERRVAALPREAASVLGLVGDEATVRARMETYAEAGLDEIALVPATLGDPDGRRTLTALAPG